MNGVIRERYRSNIFMFLCFPLGAFYVLCFMFLEKLFYPWNIPKREARGMFRYGREEVVFKKFF